MTIGCFLAILICCQVLTGASSCLAGDDGDLQEIFTMSFEELLDLEVVTSSKQLERLLQTPSAVDVLTAEEIRLLNFNTLEECLEYVTGLSSINGEGNVFTTTTIRGNTLVNYNTNTLLLFDGIPLYSPYHGSFDFGLIPLSAIERVEVVKGASSVLYGSNAISGVINVISKKNKPGERTAEIAGRLGSNDTYHGDVALLEAADQWQVRLFGDYTDTAGESLAIHDEQSNSLDFAQDRQMGSVVLKVDYKTLALHLQAYERKLPNYRTRNFGFIQENEEQYLIGNIDFRHELSPLATIHLRSNINDWSLTKDYSPAFTTSTDPYFWDYTGHLWSTDLELSGVWKQHHYTFGSNYNESRGRRYKSNTGTYDVGLYDEDTDEYSFFFNGSSQVMQKVNMVYGGRYTNSSYYSPDQRSTQRNDNFSSRAGVVYNPQTDLFIKLLYGESFRVPTYFEKGVASANVLGNPGLQPEESNSWDFIVSKQFSHVYLTVDLYQLEIDDKITRVDIGGGVFQNQNSGSVYFRGVEVSTKFKLAQNVTGFAGYSYCRGKNRDSGEVLHSTYEHMLSGALKWLMTEEFEATLSGKYLSEWGQADGYYLLNLGCNYMPPQFSGLTVEVKLDNIFSEIIDRPEISRVASEVETIPLTDEAWFYAGLRYQF